MNIKFDKMGLFDTDKIWSHPARLENTYEIIYVTSGIVYLYEDNEKYVLEKGDIILLRPNRVHGGYKNSLPRTSFYWLHFYGDIPDEFCGYQNNFIDSGLFRKIMHYDNMPLRDEDALRILTEHILFNIKEAHILNNNNKLSMEVYEWVRINISSGLTCQSVSQHFGYNFEHLSRVIKKEYGVTLKALIDKFLCDKIEDLLLNTNLSIKEISAELHFRGDTTTLINFFKYHRKISPSKYRHRYTAIHMNNS